MMTFEEKVAESIRKKREERGLSRYKLYKLLEDRTGQDYRGQVYQWETGRYAPNAYRLCLLADALDCPVDELLGRS